MTARNEHGECAECGFMEPGDPAHCSNCGHVHLRTFEIETAMTVGELRARLAEFDDSLHVKVADDDACGPDAPHQPIRHANLPEHELYVVLSTARYAHEPTGVSA